ncbi:centromere protein S-like [Actinia tenebrosa]|uniref:Centromere protein S n=1 Tax=Actinia tenebrosa TaxID=6105 RepID=A0A6P8J4Y2_ACTTE|nr:centromere protein S-like [Actinia tenebrosa]
MASDEEQDSEYETLAYQQRIKAALHYTVGRICEQIEIENGMQYSRQFIAALTETTYRQCESFAVDLELFAKHAKRTTINRDDVQLLARKSPALAKHIKSLSDEIAATNEAEKANKKTKRAKTKTKEQEENESNNETA